MWNSKFYNFIKVTSGCAWCKIDELGLLDVDFWFKDESYTAFLQFQVYRNASTTKDFLNINYEKNRNVSFEIM